MESLQNTQNCDEAAPPINFANQMNFPHRFATESDASHCIQARESRSEFVNSGTMNSVPYGFCESVCGVLPEIGKMNKLTADYSIWKLAAEMASERRLDVTIFIDHSDRAWNYEIKIWEADRNNRRTLFFQEFRKLNRQHIHLTGVWIGFPILGKRTSTLEEIVDIFEFTAPCVNLSDMKISESCTIPDKDLSRLLSFYHNATFREISCRYKAVGNEQFLLSQMQTSALKILSLSGYEWTVPFRLEIEKFALKKEFYTIDVTIPNLVFGREFFDALTQKIKSENPYRLFGATFRARFYTDAHDMLGYFHVIRRNDFRRCNRTAAIDSGR